MKKFTRVEGYAFCGRGKKIEKVEISLDGGKSWLTCYIKDNLVKSKNKNWSCVSFSFMLIDKKKNIKK